jgi:tRNA threonylcarbamoyl adenosine modification protein YeaZ
LLISAKLGFFYRKICTFAVGIVFFLDKLATIIHIETSTDVCSVAVSKDGFRLFDRTIPGSVKGSQASEQLGTLVEEAIDEAREKPDAVAVSSGPGSYTGLRIGMSMAKGLAYGSDAKLIALERQNLVLHVFGGKAKDDECRKKASDGAGRAVASAVYAG